MHELQLNLSPTIAGPLSTRFPQLFSQVWPATGLAERLARLDVASLCAEYHGLRHAAPRRSSSSKRYFQGHDGIPSTRGETNRLEEHAALALYNLQATWPLANGGGFQLLDYQVPLKSRQADAGVGKVDLLGLASDGRLVVIELKTVSASGGRGQAPPAALMEGLRYAAMLEADRTALAAEIRDRYGRELSPEPPLVALLAPRSWWGAWRAVSAAGDWAPLDGSGFARARSAARRGGRLPGLVGRRRQLRLRRPASTVWRRVQH